MIQATVYLAGPILHCTADEANDWRHAVADDLKANYGIIGISPLRCEPLLGDTYETDYADPKFGTPKAIASKNVFDVRRCDMILAYLPRCPIEVHPDRINSHNADNIAAVMAWHQSYGTIAEMALAFAYGNPAVVVTDDPEIAGHPVINALAGWVLPTMEDGIEVLGGVLGGYIPGGKHV